MFESLTGSNLEMFFSILEIFFIVFSVFSLFYVIITWFAFKGWLGTKVIVNVPYNQNFTVLRSGRYYRTLEPGLHLAIPYFEEIGHKVNISERSLDMSYQEIITSDNITLSVNGRMCFQVIDAVKAATVEDIEHVILDLSKRHFRTVIHSISFDEFIRNREFIEGRLLSNIEQATKSWGVKITYFVIRDVEWDEKSLTESKAR